ncbi:MAG: hypothetical protein E7623_04840 [Ruminococcaceae bacterium]|nr:hypothetical protein [Oscillospiraceae bacterium]
MVRSFPIDASYHTVHGLLIIYIDTKYGEGSFEAYRIFLVEKNIEEYGSYYPCKVWNIVDFAEYFNIPRSAVEEIAKNSDISYEQINISFDIDKLYSKSGEILEIDTSKLSDTKPMTIDRSYLIYTGK